MDTSGDLKKTQTLPGRAGRKPNCIYRQNRNHVLDLQVQNHGARVEGKPINLPPADAFACGGVEECLSHTDTLANIHLVFPVDRQPQSHLPYSLVFFSGTGHPKLERFPCCSPPANGTCGRLYTWLVPHRGCRFVQMSSGVEGVPFLLASFVATPVVGCLWPGLPPCLGIDEQPRVSSIVLGSGVLIAFPGFVVSESGCNECLHRYMGVLSDCSSMTVMFRTTALLAFRRSKR